MSGDFKKEKYWKLVEEFIEELKTANYWLKPDGEPLPEWKLFDTRTAAVDAARAAAWDAAGAAAWDAAWDAALFGRMLVCVSLRIDVKHLIHVNARMQVWRKGYGLLCDVNGTLYVYEKR